MAAPVGESKVQLQQQDHIRLEAPKPKKTFTITEKDCIQIANEALAGVKFAFMGLLMGTIVGLASERVTTNAQIVSFLIAKSIQGTLGVVASILVRKVFNNPDKPMIALTAASAIGLGVGNVAVPAAMAFSTLTIKKEDFVPGVAGLSVGTGLGLVVGAVGGFVITPALFVSTAILGAVAGIGGRRVITVPPTKS